MPLLPSGSPLNPTFLLKSSKTNELFQITFFPGYGRWDIDILEVVRQSGGKLREAADAIITRVENGHEKILLAIEYCGALPAGNQAWQRNGRALSFAYAEIPYIYIAELSGYELNAARERKAARLPNPAVPFSYLVLTETTQSLIIPVFIRSLGASEEAVKLHTPFYGEGDFLDFLRFTLRGEPTDIPIRKLEARVLELVKFLADSRRRKDTLSGSQWQKAFGKILDGESLPSYLVREKAIPWGKTAYIESLTKTAAKFMKVTAGFARGLTSSTLPICIIPETNRAKYAQAIAKLYPAAAPTFLKWCSGSGHLAVCWVMGFKPKGDDARPDRGLPPLCRMLVGENVDVLTVVYGPALKSTWPMLETNPAELMKRNGLWESVLVCSDALLIDTKTLSKGAATYLKNHWSATIKSHPVQQFLVTPIPDRIGEHDVDTVLHLVFARLGPPHVFEGMCNPPGGDWSGISHLTADKSLELRWLVLPRVTAEESKRPDHVLQIFDHFIPSLIVAIESKEKSQSVEENIGPRLTKYIIELIQVMPSVYRKKSSGASWSHCDDYKIEKPLPQIASVAAFVMSEKEEFETVANRANVDLILGLTFSKNPIECTIWAKSCTPIGKEICSFVEKLSLKDLKIQLKSV